jgi:NAD(P)H-nitrite reductase large subunit
MNYLVVGNGPAGTAAVEAIREIDDRGKITVISDEPVMNYSKPLISYLLGKKIKKGQLAYRHEDFYLKNAVDLVLKKEAAKLDIAGKKLILADRQNIPYGRLLIATGGVPVSLPLPGKQASGVFTFTRLRDAEKVAQYIREHSIQSAVVIGGGLIGLKATEALMERGIEVTIVELADRILSTTFDRKASEIIEGALKKRGCQVILKNSAAKIGIHRSGEVKEVVLQNKLKVPCSLVILAVGVIPNLDLIRGTPIRVNRGILVNSFMQTSVADIYSAGDCCEVEDFQGKGSRVVPIWPNAVKQGKIAGYNMAGNQKEYEGSLPMNSVELCGIPTISVGVTDPPDEAGYEKIEFLNAKRSIYKKVILQNGAIVGAIFVGDINRAGIYTGLIKNHVPVSDFKEHLLQDNFGLIYLPKEYRKHFVTEEGIEG